MATQAQRPSGPPTASAVAPDGDGLTGARLILREGLFHCAYEPIVSLHTGRVVGYEALARFDRPDGSALSPGTMFALLHGDPALLLEAELRLKRHQLEHAPRGCELFLNLDPDSWRAGAAGPGDPLLELFAAAGRPVVVEVIENLDAADVPVAHELLGALRAAGLPIALDDVGAQNSLLSFEALDEAAVLKFDRILLRRLGHPRRLAMVRAMAAAARETGARSVLEGVESAADLDLARALGVDLVQGWFFKELALESPRPAGARRDATAPPVWGPSERPGAGPDAAQPPPGSSR